MRPTRIRTVIALGLSAGAVVWTAAASPATASSPAATSEDTAWREAGHYDTTAACKRAGKAGIERHKWNEYKCRPGRNDNYVTLWARGGSGVARALTAGPAAG
ncbi:hypothetical protein GCM10017744_035710 [Streptomyces antimycoticus]|uniref:Secreted protein n=1 Tax=Streptomyces antimycoticus TaxID=68175 RepID=A0A4D4KI96_9ACTN|nr:hypothetical protein [Streptomyces antimycoticus]BBJ40684.1 hypothetical protein SSPO_034020 [Streptomyces antimycoticus]GDY45809.1 hypothetical protein SANT12839_066910 [Streptomyces antimycoticus]